ncbi:MAG TPA: SPOR domain-containing protein [Cyclobacteriaceae bacterium]|nr:SPOR domain-containing protein [Cyclobacteriaceae bacterium]
MFHASASFAQLSKAEKKAWKKELRKLTPDKLKNLVEENQHLSSLNEMLSEENNSLKTVVFKEQGEREAMESQFREISERLTIMEIQAGLITESGKRWDSGVIFKVQIGAISEKFAKDLVGKNQNFLIENNDGFHQFTIGNFRDYKEADKLKVQMRRAGIRGAWIVPYKDGKRVPLKEVLDVVIAE